MLVRAVLDATLVDSPHRPIVIKQKAISWINSPSSAPWSFIWVVETLVGLDSDATHFIESARLGITTQNKATIRNIKKALKCKFRQKSKRFY